MLNRCRLASLKSRDDLVKGVIDKTKQALISKRGDTELLTNCIVQALLQSMEADVLIRCMSDQVDLVDQLVNGWG